MTLFIATLAQMKAELGITDAQDDAVLTSWMKGLQARFEDYCERKFLRTEDCEEFHDGGTTQVCLERFPVESISSIRVDLDREFPASTELDAVDYVVNLKRGSIFYTVSEIPWPAGRQSIRVVYTGGYVAAGTTAEATQYEMPESLRRAFFMQGGFEWRNRGNLGRESISAQGATVSIAPAELLPEVKDTLSPFRRIL